MSEDSDTGLQELAAAFRRQSSMIARELHAAGRQVRATQTAIEEARQAVTARQAEHAAAVANYLALHKEAGSWMPAAELERVAPPIRASRRRGGHVNGYFDSGQRKSQ